MQQSWLDVLVTIPDPRGRHGRQSPIPSLLAALLLAVMSAQAALRGMGLWARAHADWLTRHLRFTATGYPPERLSGRSFVG